MAEVKIFSVSGQRLPILGKERLLVSVGGVQSMEDFFLVNMMEECILGVAYLKKHTCQLDFTNEVLYVEGKQVPLLKSRKVQESPAPKKSKKDVRLPEHLKNFADGLSRRPCETQDCTRCKRLEAKQEEETQDSEGVVLRTVCETLDLQEWKTKQEKDEEIGFILSKKKLGEKPDWQEISAKNAGIKYYVSVWDSLEVHEDLLFRKWESPDGRSCQWLLVVPREMVGSVMEVCHDAPSGGHFGVNKTLEKVRQRFYWPDNRKDVEDWCRRCHACVARKGPRERGRGPLKIYNVGAPFERVALDIVGPFPRTATGNKYALVVVDYFTKWPEVVPLPDQRATTIAKALLTEVVSRHGVPLELHSDQGRNFESAIFKQLMTLLGIKKTRTTPLHPQSDGLVERLIRTLLQYLSMFVADHQRDWDDWVPLFLLSYRSSKHETTKHTPSMVLTGMELRLPMDLRRGLAPNTELEEDEFIRQTQTRLAQTHEFIRQRLKITSDRMKAWYDVYTNSITFATGEKVWLYQPRRTKGKCPKLQSAWEGPYVVRDRLNDIIYRIARSSKLKPKVVHVNRLAHYKS